jgi:hypothetical protein
MKRCSSCKERRPPHAYSRCAGSPDGLQGYCKTCAREWSAAHRVTHREARSRGGVKRCDDCGHELPTTAFQPTCSRDGRLRRCRECERDRRRRAGEVSYSSGAIVWEEGGGEQPASWLYVMSYDWDERGERFGFKIGRATDVAHRARELAQCHPWQMAVHARFANSGHLEQALHDQFAPRRVAAVSAREWFRVPLDEILQAILDLRSASG